MNKFFVGLIVAVVGMFVFMYLFQPDLPDDVPVVDEPDVSHGSAFHSATDWVSRSHIYKESEIVTELPGVDCVFAGQTVYQGCFDANNLKKVTYDMNCKEVVSKEFCGVGRVCKLGKCVKKSVLGKCTPSVREVCVTTHTIKRYSLMEDCQTYEKLIECSGSKECKASGDGKAYCSWFASGKTADGDPMTHFMNCEPTVYQDCSELSENTRTVREVFADCSSVTKFEKCSDFLWKKGICQGGVCI